VGVALAFGLTVLTMAFAIGHISGCHLNPAITIGLVAGKRFPVSEALPYIVAQVIGAVLASGVLYLIASAEKKASAWPAVLLQMAMEPTLQEATRFWPVSLRSPDRGPRRGDVDTGTHHIC
jgi:glycerol uptake facilitator-like aquaporin